MLVWNGLSRIQLTIRNITWNHFTVNFFIYKLQFWFENVYSGFTLDYKHLSFIKHYVKIIKNGTSLYKETFTCFLNSLTSCAPDISFLCYSYYFLQKQNLLWRMIFRRKINNNNDFSLHLWKSCILLKKFVEQIF